MCCVFAITAANSVRAQSYNVTFTLRHSSNVTVDGVYSGLDLQSQEPSSDNSLLWGTIDTIVTYGGNNEPNSISFVDADISFTNWGGGELAPGIGGAAGTADANVGLSDAAGSLDLALRNMGFAIASDQPITLSGVSILQDDINYSVSQGWLDTRKDDVGSCDNLSGLPLALDTPPFASLIQIADELELVLPCRVILDTSDISGVAGDFLFFNGTISAIATLPVPEPSSLSLLLLGGCSAIMLRRRRRL